MRIVIMTFVFTPIFVLLHDWFFGIEWQDLWGGPSTWWPFNGNTFFHPSTIMMLYFFLSIFVSILVDIYILNKIFGKSD